ncbi:ABC transporter permease [Streptomyces omiyaensis]|uniref:ABC transporter permease n=1 Tax=Streptomyces omiyaensis TaxID=68247 RepID=A0ABW7BPF1_9ACTN|nr:ABC transporter permease [Streptomyces omiyaensis]GGY24939.1 ABC transporter [Streptomyces omiyaensis]
MSVTTAPASAPAAVRAVTVRSVLHSEWIKIRSVRSSFGSLLAVLVAALGIALAVFPAIGQPEAATGDIDRLYWLYYPMNFVQIAALAFGATAASSEYLNGALRNSLAAVPRRGLFYGAKVAVVAACALVAGVAAGFVMFFTANAFLGEYAVGIGERGALRSCFGAGLYLMLITLFSLGLTFLLRSAVAVLSLLIPFLLLVSFVIGGVSEGAATWLPDRAGQQILFQDPTGPLGPWSGLGVTALSAAAVLLAGWWAVRRRDA